MLGVLALKFPHGRMSGGKSPGWLELIEFTFFFLLQREMGVGFPRDLCPPTMLPEPSL